MNPEEIKKKITLNLEELQALKNMPPVTDRMFADIIKLREARMRNLTKANRELTKHLGGL